MHMKSSSPIRIYLGLLATLAAASSIDAVASSTVVTTADLNTGRHRQAVVAIARYDGPAQATRAVYTVPSVDRRPVEMNAPRVSEHEMSEPEVGGWKLLLAVIGLIGIRLWHAGKKTLPLIG